VGIQKNIFFKTCIHQFTSISLSVLSQKKHFRVQNTYICSREPRVCERVTLFWHFYYCSKSQLLSKG